jgi:hypothetical protein
VYRAASTGNRLIAAEVTIENAFDDYPIYVCGSSFKVTDSGGFTFPATSSRLQPVIAEGLPLDPGEKTKGWVMFEVVEGSVIEKLQYWSSEVSLPDRP